MLEKRESFALSAGNVENPTLVGLNGSGRGIKLAGLLDLVQSFGEAPGSQQERRIPVMSLHEVRIQFQRPFVFAFRGHRIPIPVEGSERQGIVSSRGGVVELDGLLGRGQSAWIGFIWRHDAEFTQQVIAVGQPHVGLGVTGVFHDRLGEVIDRLIQIFWSALGPVILAFEIELLRFGLGRVRCSQRILVPGLTMAEREHADQTRDHHQWREPNHNPGKRRLVWSRSRS